MRMSNTEQLVMEQQLTKNVKKKNRIENKA